LSWYLQTKWKRGYLQRVNLSSMRVSVKKIPRISDFVIKFYKLDMITAVEYSMNGDYLATGDRNGRITMLKLDVDNKAKVRKCIIVFTSF